MTKQEFENKSFDEVILQLEYDFDQIVSKEWLQNYCKDLIDRGTYAVVIHILSAMNEDDCDYDWYDYDWHLGVCDTPVGVSCKEDIEHLIDDKEENKYE